MSETPDLRALAERYLDLWEEQFAAAASDPAAAAAMAAWLEPWRALAAGAAGATTGTGRKREDGRDGAHAKAERGAPATGSATAGAAAAGAAPGDGGRRLDQLLERLDRIERRLDALERQRDGKGHSAGARRGRSRRAGGAG
jgi:hypothetical protein